MHKTLISIAGKTCYKQENCDLGAKSTEIITMWEHLILIINSSAKAQVSFVNVSSKKHSQNSTDLKYILKKTFYNCV